MGRPRKEQTIATESTGSGDKVKILSLRLGDIQLPGGVSVKHQSVIELPVEQVEYLEKSFKDQIRRV